ncbi:hypothetical protein [Streptomyces lasiicapitis]|uniref:Uncharacterized protein n=1 Tax=Streptomyces lasiicapitis TaxID=1923961 RepID=A0ABQ2LQT8_9ACTN|nr:hypothetical protein [Streptomyces lasiicapitis]GGO42200.1 hypothetical protein GCM10012286_23190 [Streptomyces lasiicapitis]
MSAQSPVVVEVLVLLAALIAAGAGAVAWLKLARDRRPGVAARLWLADTPYYRITHHGRNRYRVEPTESLAAYPRGSVPGASTQPELRIDVTNTRERTVSINQVELAFGTLATDGGRAPDGAPPTAPAPRIVVTFHAGHDESARTTLAAAFSLVAERSDEDAVRYATARPAAPAELEELVRRITAHPSVATAVLDVTGEPHSAFERMEVVQLRLRHGTVGYRHPVGHHVAAGESLMIPLAIGAESPVTGSAVIRLLLDGRHSLDIGRLDLRLAPPARIAVLQDDSDAGTASTHGDGEGSPR